MNLDLGSRNEGIELAGGFYMGRPRDGEKSFQVGVGVGAAYDNSKGRLSAEFVKYLGDKGETRLMGAVGLRGSLTPRVNMMVQLHPGLRVREDNVDVLLNGTLNVEVPVTNRMTFSAGPGLYGAPENEKLMDAFGFQAGLSVMW